jgi:hypothetical protein
MVFSWRKPALTGQEPHIGRNRLALRGGIYMVRIHRDEDEVTFQGLVTLLPGPDRKRQLKSYLYRLIYRNPLPGSVGCVSTWEVEGGRLVYQVSLERQDDGGLRWHCSCADAIYRGEEENRPCKHVIGLRKAGVEVPAWMGQDVRIGA